MLHSVSELDIQRCVDGELSDDDRARLLGRLDDSDSGWRDLALAFVENQVIGQACREAGRSTQMQRSTVVPLARPTSAKPRRFAPPAWSVTAAAAVCGAALGLLAGNRPLPQVAPADEQPVVADAPDDAEQHDNLDQGLDDVVPRPVMNMEFADASGDASHWTLPVYDPHDVGEDYWQVHDVLSEEVREDLSRQGYRLDHDRQYYSIPLDDGREIAVPVDTVQVRYTGL